MKPRGFIQAVGLLAACMVLIVAVIFSGIFAFVYHVYRSEGWDVSAQELSDMLQRTETGYVFSGGQMMDGESWAMLIGQDGRVRWSLHKPQDVPECYTLTDVASFTRWYLIDYPVQCHIREDGLFVVGMPHGSVWKYSASLNMQTLRQIPYWFAGMFLLALGCVLALAYGMMWRWFRQGQRIRDTARSGWINGVSHDIRTPLSVAMGYAAQMETDEALSKARRRQAAIIRGQCQAIRDLVNDLNLTMRLDCEMQALRKERLQPEVFIRHLAADFLNGGLAEGFPLETVLPQTPLPPLNADVFLLRRAVNNLLINCVRHNEPGCIIRLGACAPEDGKVVLWVEGGHAQGKAHLEKEQKTEEDGGAAHGTGLKLVAQIVAAHGGQAKFYSGTTYRCELWLPAAR